MDEEEVPKKQTSQSKDSKEASAEKGKRGRKKASSSIEEEKVESFPAPKPKKETSGKKRGRKPKSVGKKANSDSEGSSNKEESESPVRIKNIKDDFEDDMKLEEDDELEIEEENDEDGDDFPEGNLSTKNILKLVRHGDDTEFVQDNVNIDMNKLTKRQKSQLRAAANIKLDDIEEPLLSLPDRKHRKRKNAYLTEEQQVKKMEIAIKRKLLNQKIQEEQKKSTINKILNEAGRMQRLRREREEKTQAEKDNYKYKTLPQGEIGIKHVNKGTGSYLVIPPGFNINNLFCDEF